MSTRKNMVKTTTKLPPKSTKKQEEPVHDPDADGRDEDDEYDENQEIDMQPIEVKRVPVDQISSLTEEQKNEVFTKVITATNPNLNRHAARFNYAESQFRPVATSTMDHLSVHFEMDAILIHCDSDEARDQAHLIAEQERQMREQAEKKHTREDDAGATTGTGAAERKGGDDDDEDEFIVPPSDRALKNQFNFSERATQTFNNPKRDREVATEPPPTSEFSENVTHWEIFDTYVEDLDRQMQAKAAKEKGTTKAPKVTYDDDTTLPTPTQPLTGPDAIFFSEAMANALKTMERMVNQNAEAEIFHDYAYYDDTSDTRSGDADTRSSFLPLWRFQNAAAKRKTVTSIVWNPAFHDLFAVGFGSYDFTKQTDGLIAVYTLKNTQHPEYMFTTESGVMSLDFHPQHPSLLVAGLYDGTVCVYDVRSKSNSPIFISENPKVKHTDPVWQVRWQAVSTTEEVGSHISFFSISSDGRVTNWIINKNELINEEIISLKLVARSEKEERIAEGVLLGLAGGCCFDFNPVSEHLFVVGTEEGALHAYSKAYNSQHIRTFEGHHMAIYSVRWNPFHAGVFLSCSADWTVKLWEVNVPTPIMTFDLNCSVADVAWAPYSSTVFAVITTDGKVRLYDLSINKHEPIGQSIVNKKSKLTHLAFNPRSPVICVGDDHGTVNSLKLSAALRGPISNDIPDRDTETEKLEKLMIIPPRQGNINVWVKREEVKDAKGNKLKQPLKGRSVPSSSQGTRAEKKIELEESKENGEEEDKIAE